MRSPERSSQAEASAWSSRDRSRTGGWHARLTEDAVHLDPHNLALEPVSLDAETAETIDQILTDARHRATRRVRGEPRI